jgi:hypothetical protein
VAPVLCDKARGRVGSREGTSGPTEIDSQEVTNARPCIGVSDRAEASGWHVGGLMGAVAESRLGKSAFEPTRSAAVRSFLEARPASVCHNAASRSGLFLE